MARLSLEQNSSTSIPSSTVASTNTDAEEADTEEDEALEMARRLSLRDGKSNENEDIQLAIQNSLPTKFYYCPFSK